MRDDEHGQPLLRKLPHDVQNLADHLRVKRAGRLVEEQDLRFHRQRAGDGHALLLPAGELCGLSVDVGRHADLGQVLHGDLLGLAAAALQNGHLSGDAVVQRRHVVNKIEALKNHADLGAVLGKIKVAARDVLAVVEDLPGGRGFQHIDAAQHRALAGAGGADDAQHLALFHAQADVTQNLMRSNLFLQMDQLDYLFSHVVRPPCGCESRHCCRSASRIWCSCPCHPASSPRGAAGA